MKIITQSLIFAIISCFTNVSPIRVSAQVTHLSYLPDTSDFPNPERGFYHQWLSDSKAPSPLNARQFNQLRQNNLTLIRRLYSLTTFRSTPISDSFLQHIRQDMQALRQNGVKAILRFAYTFNEPPPHNDAPLSIIQTHLTQLAPVLKENADVIAYLEAGFIGRWGEWHTSSNKLDNTSDRRAVLLKLLDVLPPSRTVAIRTQQMKKDIFLETKPIALTEAFTETYRARTAHHNDCFCADIDDFGTYWPVDANNLGLQKKYLNQENRFLPQGGETCNFNPPYSDCDAALKDLIQMRWSTLNDDYHPEVLATWKSQSCYAEIHKRLGYRFRLLEGYFPPAVAPGSTLNFRLSLKNEGFATPYNSRDVELVLRAKSNGATFRFKLGGQDPRLWFPDNETIPMAASILIPANLPPDEYQLLLNFPDPALSLNEIGAFSIRLANQKVWEPTTGYNDLLTTIRVDQTTRATSAPSSSLITLYPNPADQEIRLEYTLTARTQILIQVFDLMGRAVLAPIKINQPAGQHHLVIPTSLLPKGIFALKGTLGQHRITQYLVIGR